MLPLSTGCRARFALNTSENYLTPHGALDRPTTVNVINSKIMKIEITVTKAELGQLGQLPSERVKSFIWKQITCSPDETGEKIDLNKIDVDVIIKVV